MVLIALKTLMILIVLGSVANGWTIDDHLLVLAEGVMVRQLEAACQPLSRHVLLSGHVR